MLTMTSRPVLFAALLGVVSGCVPPSRGPSLYESWHSSLAGNSGLWTKSEVSMRLGAPPVKCETEESPRPTFGLSISTDSPTVIAVAVGGPAEKAGLRKGDRIISIAGTPITDGVQARTVLADSRWDVSQAEFITSRGTLLIGRATVPIEQCYWDIRAGGVSQGGGSAYVNAYGGAAGSSYSARERFFRTTCRFSQGVVYTCASNWQE